MGTTAKTAIKKPAAKKVAAKKAVAKKTAVKAVAATEVAKVEPVSEVITAYKGFDQNLQCRGYQFEIGKTFTHEGEVKACSSGFHSCENPLDVLNYYPLNSRFAVVKAGGKISKHEDESKIASATITLEAELKLPEFIKAAIDWMMAACKTGDGAQAASGDSSQLAASGYSSQLAASGDSSQLAASGDSSIAMAAATNCIAKAGKDGCIALTRWVESEKRYRVSVGYVGEGLDADTWYQLDSEGNFVKVEG